ncbi:MAG: 2-oxoacid:acceptor oxidoreductase family protein [Proteobacteria bacterium]|nr:2-oxoacid:acceptor oxidoreductase family protein [Pseudomonadota bacterium]
MSGFEIRFSGAGGQGLQLCAKLLSAALAREGKTVAASQGYEPTSRGGLSRSDMVVSDKGAAEYPLVTALDYLLVLDRAAAGLSEGLVRKDGLILADTRRVDKIPGGKYEIRQMPFSETAMRLGNERVANVIALSALIAISGICTRETLEQTIRTGTPPKFLDLNIEAMNEGYAMADEEVAAA